MTNLETPAAARSGAPPVAVASPRFATLSPPPSLYSPSVNPSLSLGQPPATFHTENHSASPPAYLKTPEQVVADLLSISNVGTFYIVTKGREPGIYTDW
jgi:hypothetical protein